MQLPSPPPTSPGGDAQLAALKATAGRSHRFVDATSRANLAVMGLAVAGVVHLITVFALSGRLDIANRLLGGTGATVDEANASDNLVSLTAWMDLGVLVLAAVGFLMWLHRVVINNHALERRRLAFTPRSAVGWWFVPIANLVRGYQVVAESWKAADPRSATSAPYQAPAGPTPALLLTWWLVYIGSGLLSTISVAVRGGATGGLQALHDATVVGLVAEAAYVVAATLAATVVLRLTRRQNALRVAVDAATAAA